MKRIAIPISDGKLSRHFGGCSHYMIFGIDGSDVRSHYLDAPGYHDVTKLPAWVAGQQITDIIAYQIDKEIIDLFTRHKINVWVGAPDVAPEILIRDYLNGTLVSDSKVLGYESSKKK